MGCGQSHIAIIYPRKSKNKDGNKTNDNEDGEGDTDNRLQQSGSAEGVQSSAGLSIQEIEEARLRAAARVRQMVQITSGPLLAQTELSSSQTDFFRMLDEKIESGPDYDSTCEYEVALEHARLCKLLRDWESAKQRSARSRSAPSTPSKRFIQANGDALQQQRNYSFRPTQWYHPYQPQYQFSNSVVMYDKTHGSYYTELA
ncbi:target of wingless repressor isoform X2 [Lycorma delicatula]|uniref:target of wingless repressor isoform X2 n=1 Tax=Lycorma delicatula TaxID=130591 RepID=UPI003F51008E